MQPRHLICTKKVVVTLKAIDIVKQAEQNMGDYFASLEETAYKNQLKILQAFQKNRVRELHFQPSSGYGYDDAGREVLESLYSEIFQAEDAMVRSQIVSGTHAISACLFGLLAPGDSLLSVTGKPYDTLAGIISKSPGCLISKGIHYDETVLNKQGRPDLQRIADQMTPSTTMVMIQRSRGYSLRPALNIDDIQAISRLVKQINPNTIIFVDNCYGEFVEQREPIEAGADLAAGSLIKNPGGGLAASGGYIVGKNDLVERISYHLTAPGLGKELGATLINKRPLFQGLFMAPHIVLQSLKGASLLAYIFTELGFDVYPKWNEQRGDIVQAVKLNNSSEVVRFCQTIQQNSPVDSDVHLEYAELPGYADKVVMAAGTFVQGSSIELSCDAPMREPYCVYLQGGLTYEHCKYVVLQLIESVILNPR